MSLVHLFSYIIPSRTFVFVFPNVHLMYLPCHGSQCRASSGEGSWKALHSLSKEAGFSPATTGELLKELCSFSSYSPVRILFRKPGFMSCRFIFPLCARRLVEAGPSISDGAMSSATWKLHYYEWAMQIFERYNISEGACQFAYAALEQVDEAYNFIERTEEFDITKAATYTRGRLWANVFKFTLDLNLLNDAYCAIISNPDEEIKRICLRRFIIVLFECGKTKVEVKNAFLLLS